MVGGSQHTSGEMAFLTVLFSAEQLDRHLYYPWRYFA